MRPHWFWNWIDRRNMQMTRREFKAWASEIRRPFDASDYEEVTRPVGAGSVDEEGT